MIDPSTYDDAAMWPGGPDDHGPSRITVRRQIAAWEAVPEEQRMTFEDMLDIVNPLQHIPLVSTAYRELTGDEIRGPARILGGLVYGGPVGFASAMAESVFVESTGNDFGGTAVAMVLGEDERPVYTAADGGTYAELPADAAAAGAPALAQAAPTGQMAMPAMPLPGQGTPAILEGLTGPSVSMAPMPGGAAATATAPLSGDSRLDAALMALAIENEPATPGDAEREEDRQAAPAAGSSRYAGWPVAAPGRRVPVPETGHVMSDAVNAYQALAPSTGPLAAGTAPPAGGLLGTY